MSHWSNEPQPFGANHAPLLTGLASDGSGPVPIAVDAATGSVLTQGVASIASTLLAFVTAVSSAGTRVQLVSHTLTNGAILQAPSTNTGVIYVGGSDVSSSVYGAELQPGQATSFAVSNSNLVYIDASQSGDKCALLGS